MSHPVHQPPVEADQDPPPSKRPRVVSQEADKLPRTVSPSLKTSNKSLAHEQVGFIATSWTNSAFATNNPTSTLTPARLLEELKELSSMKSDVSWAERLKWGASLVRPFAKMVEENQKAIEADKQALEDIMNQASEVLRNE